MAHYMRYFPKTFLGAWDFETGPKTLTIASIGTQALRRPGGAEEQKPVIRWQEADVRPLVLNKTNAAMIAEMYGEDTDLWIGQALTLHRATVDMAGREVFAIRVRLAAPPAPHAAPAPAAGPGYVQPMAPPVKRYPAASSARPAPARKAVRR